MKLRFQGSKDEKGFEIIQVEKGKQRKSQMRNTACHQPNRDPVLKNDTSTISLLKSAWTFLHHRKQMLNRSNSVLSLASAAQIKLVLWKAPHYVH